jgi:hypothetical protein
MALTLNDVQFNQHPSTFGFQGELVIWDWYSINITCGPSVYIQEGADVAEKANALDYTTFEYILRTPADEAEITPSDWIGPVTVAQLNQVIAETEAIVTLPEITEEGT